MASSSSSEPRDPPPLVELCKGVNNLDKIVLRELGGSSVEAFFAPPKPIRGGIPICFPQFEGFGSLEKHGFVRSRVWRVDTKPPPPPKHPSIKAYIDLILKPSEMDCIIWPHKFELRLRIMLGPDGELTLDSRVKNTNTDNRKPFKFRFAYHTYFSVSDIGEIRVEGLETTDYFDNTKNGQRFTEQGNAITFEAELDKVYLSTQQKISIVDHEKRRTTVLRKEGLPDAVVWNPWDKKAKAIADFGDKQYRNMLCVQAAAIEKPITLKPGQEWRGRQILSVVTSSFKNGQLDPQNLLALH
ncbi:hypothetical protein V2J09_009564 [Rumex salicifolius]